MAFQAVNRPLRSAVKVISTVLSVAGFAGGTVTPGTVAPVGMVVPPVVPPPAGPVPPPDAVSV